MKSALITLACTFMACSFTGNSKYVEMEFAIKRFERRLELCYQKYQICRKSDGPTYCSERFDKCTDAVERDWDDLVKRKGWK